MVESNTNKEHGEPPSEGSEHALVPVPVGILAQKGDHGRVGQCDGRRAEEFSYEHQKKQKEEDFLNVLSKTNTL
jgi:hypothetical protein